MCKVDAGLGRSPSDRRDRSRLGASRAYHAAFHGVTAVLATRGLAFTKHTAVRAALHRDLIQAQLLPADLGKDYDFLLDLRETADFLQAERLLEAATATATKRVIAHQIATEVKRRRLTKMAMASRMKTSRAALDRLLDPDNRSVTIGTLEKAAAALNRRLAVELR